MKSLKFFLSSFAILAVFGLTLGSAKAASTSGNASATIAVPISVSESSALSFGSVIRSASAGTVVINTSGTRSVTGGVTALGGTVSAASFAVSGEGSAAYTISFTDGTLTGPGTSMAVSTFTNDGSGSLSGGGSETVNVGATLSVGANQTEGAYTGTYTVTVNYQ